jgi:broad-specificity NMP kinase
MTGCREESWSDGRKGRKNDDPRPQYVRRPAHLGCARRAEAIHGRRRERMHATGCAACEVWGEHSVEREAASVRLRCQNCGQVTIRPMRILPLFIVTGASGVGKTSVVDELQRLMPDWHVFETDILWDSGGDWQFVRQNWLRIAHRIAQTGRATILCGTHLPEQIDACDHRDFFSQVYSLILHCEDAALAKRLRGRPAWHNQTEAFIAEQRRFNLWLVENAATAFDPPAALVDTTGIAIAEAARQIRDWAMTAWQEQTPCEAGAARCGERVTGGPSE